MKTAGRTIFLALFYCSFVLAILTATAEKTFGSQPLGPVTVTEPFYGQLIIALVAAVPPTGMMIVALIALLRGQQQMKVALDGKLDKLMAAEKGVSKAEGVKEEREENRSRAALTPEPVKVEIVQPEESPVPVVDKKM